MLDAPVIPTRWDLYRVLSEPARLRLLALCAEEELAVLELAELLGESQPNVSRHAAPLKQAGLLSVRRQGTRTLLRLREDAASDPVIADALASGRALCDADGSIARVSEVLRARDAVAREYFAQPRKGEKNELARPPAEIGAYLAALASLLPHRDLAVDAGTGDGGLLDVLAPTFKRVVGIDRSLAQLERAKERVALRGYANVALVEGELAGPEVGRAVGRGADVVFAARLLHHAPKPAAVVAELAKLTAPGGALVILDYAHHDDESMREQADLWLGFEASELKKFARSAGLEGAEVTPLPSALIGRGPDAHLPWQILIARKNSTSASTARRSQKGTDHHG